MTFHSTEESSRPSMAIHVTLFRVNRTIAFTIAMRHVQWMWLWGRIFVMMFVLTWCSHVCKSVSTPGDSHSACQTTHKSELPIRIVGGSFLHQGRIEILASEEWSTVCNNIWHPSNADVVCRQLGFLQADVLGPTLMGGAQFGQGQGPMFIEDFKCAGNESYLGQCSCSKPTTQSCQRAEDAVVSCQERPLPVRLVGGESPLDGAVTVLYGKQWLPVCHDQWGIDEAMAVCQQLGFNYALSATAQHPKETTGAGSPKSLRQRLDFSCPRWQEFLTLCKSSGPSVGNCVMNAGVVCSNQSSPNAGAVIRLSPEEGSSKGRVEIDYFGTWWSLCSEGWDIAAAQVACRQLGFQFALPVDLSEDCAKLTKSILISNIVCKGTEGSLAECQQEFATVDECNSDRMAVVECSDSEPTPMPDFQVRLKDGYFPYEGRVEISYEGQWGTVCDDNWDYTDADVVCQQLGYYAASAAAAQAYFGEGTGPILLDDVECLGNETHLLDCAHQGIGNHNCKHNEDAGVQCHESKIPLVTMYPETADSFLPLIVVLINGLIALLIVISCLIYCSLKLWDRHVLRRHIAHIRQAQNATGGDNNTPMEYIDDPPAYNTVLENQDVYIRQRSETPPPDYDEVMKLHRADTTHV